MQSNDTSNAAANSSHKKHLKVPKRGPGVSELEKMMREQNGIYTTDKRISELTDRNQYDSTHFASKNLYSESNPFWSYFGTVLKRNHESSPLKKMVSMTQSHSSTMESDLIPPSNLRVIPSFSYYNRPLRSSINDSHSVSRFNSNHECYRDAKWGRTLELSNTRYNSDIEVHGSANVPPFSTAEVPSPPLHLFPVHPCQVIEGKVNSYQQHSEASGLYSTPFYNFLEVGGVTKDTNPGGCEAGKLGIDLNLKL